MKKVIEAVDLSKNYKLKRPWKVLKALDNINLTVNKGEIFGLLGPNGAGKTTLIEILTTIKQPTSGFVAINGYDVISQPKKVKPLIGLMLGGEMLYHRITGYDNLKFFCKIYKIPNYKKKIQEIAEEFGLTKWLDQYVEYFSSGMKMKLALCRTLLLERDILFLDEPTLGLDVKSKSFIIEKIRNLDKTIFLTSHDMGVVEKLCERVAFINSGKILKIGTKSEVKTLTESEVKVNIEIKDKKPELKKLLMQQNFIKEVSENEKGLLIRLHKREDYSNLFEFLSKFKILRISEQDISLEELFLRLIE
ncbi:MAG: ABC transporter ATP-binding protein [Candidatus Hermodarchaeota archaeon]